MPQESKTHYEAVPLEIAQKLAEEHIAEEQIAEEQIAIGPSQAARGELFRDPTRKRVGKARKTSAKMTDAEIAGERKDL